MLLTGAILMGSWKNYETNKVAAQWFEVEDTGSTPGNPDNQQIVGLYPGGAPGTECNRPNGNICAVEMNLDGAPVPSTIAEANDQGFNTDTRRHKAN